MPYMDGAPGQHGNYFISCHFYMLNKLSVVIEVTTKEHRIRSTMRVLS